MDVAYNQHSSAAKRKNRSTTNLNHLSLAPLTSRLPLEDQEELPDTWSAPAHTTSYLQGKSAPTTPGLLSRSAGRSHSRTRGSSASAAALPKSKSTTHLTHNGRRSVSGTSSPNIKRKRNDAPPANETTDTDWMLRAAALISTETRESKGQAWLVSRESSTSLTGVRDTEEEVMEREFVRERELASRGASRRGSWTPADEDRGSSPSHSRLGSRSQSRAGSRSQMMTPIDRRSMESYFPYAVEEDYLEGPDFVNLDARLEAIEQDTSAEDEAHVRRLVKKGNAGVGTWFGSVLGWQLSSVEENEEESDPEYETTEADSEDLARGGRLSSTRQFEGFPTLDEERMPPPKPDEGGWQDAAWLLSVASKVLL